MKTSMLIPKDRIGVINKKVMIELKERLGVEISRKENAAEIDGSGLELLQAKNIIKAIGRGFSPVRAYRLLEDDQELEVIEIEKRTDVVKSRIIGTKGRTREKIEDCTGAVVSVYGKTVSIIGGWEQIKNAKIAIEMIINGAMHKSVYNFLDKIKREKS